MAVRTRRQVFLTQDSELFKKIFCRFGRMALKHVKYHVWNELPVQVRCTILDGWAGALGRPRGMVWASVLVAHGLSCPWVVNLPVPRIKPVSPDLAGRLSNTGPSGKSKTVRLRQEAFFLFSTSKLLNIYVFIPSFNSVHFYCLYLEVM